MKKYLGIWTLAALFCGIGLVAVSCGKDSIEEVTLDADYVQKGINTDMQSAIISVPVNCDGEWTATLQKGTDWARILDWKVIFEGKQNLRIVVDENLTKADRSTTLNIGDMNGDITHIKLSQFYNFEGEAPTNGSGQAFADKGLGTAIDYDYALNTKLNATRAEEFDPTKLHGMNNVFNISMIQELQKRSVNPLKKSAYVEAVIPIAELHSVMADSLIMQDKTLDVALTLGIEFGPISFNAHGEYNSHKFEERVHADYLIVRNCPMYNVYLSPAELSTFAADPNNNEMDLDSEDATWADIETLIARFQRQNKRRKNIEVNEDGLTEEQQTEIDNMIENIPVLYDYAGVFSSDFTKRYNELFNAITRPILRNKEPDPQKVEEIFNAIDNAYGPFIIAGGNYGGSLSMHCRVDISQMEGAEDFYGELTANFAGMFDVEGEFKYTADGVERLRSYNPDIYIWGGNANETTDNMLSALFSNDVTDIEQWQDCMKNWIASMYSPEGDDPDQSQAAPISYVFTPIWTLFSDSHIQQACQDYFMEKYEDRGIYKYFSMMQPGATLPNTDDLIDVNSEWNQSDR